MEIKNRKIHELIEENHVFASVLFYFGISFYEYPDKTLGQVCKIRGIKEEDLIESLENSVISNRLDPEFSQLPVDLVVEYTKHKHQHYVSKTLPYVSQLLDGYNFVNLENQQVVQLLRDQFLVFSQGLIDQIHYKEKNLFEYVLQIEAAFRNNDFFNCNLYLAMEEKASSTWSKHITPLYEGLSSCIEIVRGHQVQEDDLFLSVIFAELHDFAKQLRRLAQIEKEILIPRATNLEKEISNKISATIPQN